MSLGSNLSALWILVVNGWMQNPIAADFNYETRRMEMVSFADLVLNLVAQVKFVHTVAAGYCTGAMFVLGISSYYLLKGRDIAFAKRSFAIAASFGIAAVLSVIVLGDESGYEMGDVQKNQLCGRFPWSWRSPLRAVFSGRLRVSPLRPVRCPGGREWSSFGRFAPVSCTVPAFRPRRLRWRLVFLPLPAMLVMIGALIYSFS